MIRFFFFFIIIAYWTLSLEQFSVKKQEVSYRFFSYLFGQGKALGFDWTFKELSQAAGWYI
jgi:hypothetical protein